MGWKCKVLPSDQGPAVAGGVLWAGDESGGWGSVDGGVNMPPPLKNWGGMFTGYH